MCIQVKKKCYFASILLGYFVSILLFMKLSCASHLQSNFFVNYWNNSYQKDVNELKDVEEVQKRRK